MINTIGFLLVFLNAFIFTHIATTISNEKEDYACYLEQKEKTKAEMEAQDFTECHKR